MQAILLWQLSTVAGTNVALARPMIVVIGLATAVCGLIAWRFIFPVPALFSVVLVACLGAAYYAARSAVTG